MHGQTKIKFICYAISAFVGVLFSETQTLYLNKLPPSKIGHYNYCHSYYLSLLSSSLLKLSSLSSSSAEYLQLQGLNKILLYYNSILRPHVLEYKKVRTQILYMFMLYVYIVYIHNTVQSGLSWTSKFGISTYRGHLHYNLMKSHVPHLCYIVYIRY